jgi:hypothetical protein
MTAVTRSGKVWEVEIENLVCHIADLDQAIAINRGRFAELMDAHRRAKKALVKLRAKAAADTLERVDVGKLYACSPERMLELRRKLARKVDKATIEHKTM